MNEKAFTKGDKVSYKPPKEFKDESELNYPIQEATIIEFLPYSGPSGVFNQDMAVINKLEQYWIPASSLTKLS